LAVPLCGAAGWWYLVNDVHGPVEACLGAAPFDQDLRRARPTGTRGNQDGHREEADGRTRRRPAARYHQRPPEAGFYLVSWQVDAITLLQAEGQLRGLEDRLEAIQHQHGLMEEESWLSGEGPPEYEEAQRQLYDAWEALYAAKLDELGEPEMARLYRTDRERFEQLSEAGRAFFHGPRTEEGEEGVEVDWLDGLLADVTACVEAEIPMGLSGPHCRVGR
jgi:hypothetical protein